ncbi:hypothetical protein [Brevifollis gellanilyticus]|uniref:Uncharacterized protein n=1 Tax=Brevifollis gellanilyticus TaxID=748831 RepID=A0A512MDN1_9BACT|nr:hypothetical protein [Brevifollis gellanilyticus]GEP44491.1 hypothetical protein BGE01nite_37820 [Brevifollis gellanilyticus]
MELGGKHSFWRITQLGELPFRGDSVWFCHEGTLARGTYVSPSLWFDIHTTRLLELETAPPYWTPAFPGDDAPLPPGHHAAHERPHNGQAVLAFTQDPAPIQVTYQNATREWMDSSHQPVAGVRFWKTPGEHQRDLDQPAPNILHPRLTSTFRDTAPPLKAQA